MDISVVCSRVPASPSVVRLPSFRPLPAAPRGKGHRRRGEQAVEDQNRAEERRTRPHRVQPEAARELSIIACACPPEYLSPWFLCVLVK